MRQITKPEDILQNTSDYEDMPYETNDETNKGKIKGYKRVKKKCWYFGKISYETKDEEVESWLKNDINLSLLGFGLVPSRHKKYKGYRVTLSEHEIPPEDNDTRLLELGVYFREFIFRDDDCIATKNKSNPFDNRTKKGGEMRLSRHEKTHFKTNTPGRAISRTNHTYRSKTPNRYGSQKTTQQKQNESKNPRRTNHRYRYDQSSSDTETQFSRRQNTGQQSGRLNECYENSRRCLHH